MTFDLAINPDFAQVEADQIVVTANQVDIDAGQLAAKIAKSAGFGFLP